MTRQARIVPLLYLATAHAALLLACFLVACWPRAVAGFYYHAWMLAVVHLVTLGWITGSILGAMYIVGPVALGLPMPPRRSDYVAFACVFIGIVGMVAHFWIQEYGGMAWSAATVTIGVLLVLARVVRGIKSASPHPAVKLHVLFACINFLIAASMGVLLGFDKAHHFLPGFVLSNVFAHAHLAALGWATMMVVGVGYRLLPMTFPSKMPNGRSMFASAILLEIGVLGLFGSLLLQSAVAPLFGACIIAGLAVFAGHVVWMRCSPLRKPLAAPRVDFGVLHAAAAGVSLVAAIVIGTVLLVLPVSPRTLHAAAAYGVFGLVGFLAQMVVAMEARLLPLFVWYWAYARGGRRVPPASPHAMRDRTLQAIVFTAWTAGVPALAAGMWLESAPLVGLGGWSLLAAVAIGTLDNLFVVSHVARQHPHRDQAEHDEVREQQRRHRRRAAQDALEEADARLPQDRFRMEREAEEADERVHHQDRCA